MVRLLNAAPKGCQIVFGGDTIDRGPNSRKVVEFAMDNAIPTVAANHENLALAFYGRDTHGCSVMYEPGIWLSNGGKDALKNWPVKWKDGETDAGRKRDQRLKGRIPDTVLDWMETLPPYLYPSTVLDSNARRLLLSHTGFGLAADEGNWFQALWGRHIEGDGDFPDDGNFRIVGHSFVKEAVVTDHFVYLDTGAAYAARGGGTMTAMLWPSKQLLTQAYDETPTPQRFSVERGGLLT